MNAKVGMAKFAILAGAVVAVLLVFGFLVFASFATSSPAGRIAQADGIVVLTGGKLRIDEGMRLLRDGRGKRLLITGVNPRTTPKDVRRLASPGKRLFECCVDFGYMAQDTVGNARETLDWVKRNKFRSLIVVTSSYHMPRSMTELGRYLPAVKLIANPVVPVSFRERAWWLNHAVARVLLAEYLKLIPSAARYLVTRMVRPLVSEEAAQGAGALAAS